MHLTCHAPNKTASDETTSHCKHYTGHGETMSGEMWRSKHLAMFLLLGSLSCAAASSVGDRLNVGIWIQDSMPLNTSIAEEDGWAQVGDSACDVLYGRRYQLDGRLTPTLLFDNTGTLAGIQIVTNTSTFPLWPDTNLKAPLVHLIEDELAAMTFYLMDPAKLCSAVAADHTEGSIGDRLWVRTDETCNTAACFDVFPLEESDDMLDGLSYRYDKGGCAPAGFAYTGSPGMGTHYWGNSTADYACEDTGPLFLLYDRSKLVAFGLTYMGQDMQVPTMGGVRPDPPTAAAIGDPSRWEFAHQPLYPYFFDQATMSDCLENLNTFDASLPHGSITTGTMHIFLSDPFAMTCESSDNSNDTVTTVDDSDSSTTSSTLSVSGSTTVSVTVPGVWFSVLASCVLLEISL